MENLKNKIMKKSFESMSMKEKVQFVCVLLPILCTLAGILGEVFKSIGFLSLFFMAIYAVGFLSAIVGIILTKPLACLKIAFSWIAKGWMLGMTIVPIFPICFISALIFACFAYGAVMILFVVAPAVVTIYMYAFYED